MAREAETAGAAPSALATTVANNSNSGSGNEIAEAREVAEWIHGSGDIFLERLISHLSQLPGLKPVPEADDRSKRESTETSKENSSGEIGNECSGEQNDNDDNDNDDDDNDDESLLLRRGMTLPAAAVAWLSGQLEALDRTKLKSEQQTGPLDNDDDDDGNDDNDNDDDDDDDDAVKGDPPQPTTEMILRERLPQDAEPWIGSEAASLLRSRLNLLRRLLPRARLIRLNRQPWPPTKPPLCWSLSSTSSSSSFSFSSKLSKQRLKKWWKQQRQHARTATGIDPVGNDSGSIETDGSIAGAVEFLQCSGLFPNGGAPGCIRLHRVFPSATVLILEGVPPSWIELDGTGTDLATKGTNSTAATPNGAQPWTAPLGVISVRKAAIYSLEEFLPAVSEVPSRNSTPPPTASASLSLPLPRMTTPLSSSLTHLKLESCSLGELTRGFASGLSRLVRLEYLSLRRNEFRTAKTLLRGLRPLTRLRYLDVSCNRIAGCFGPRANLCLGGQVRTLVLSNNLLETCRNSGLEKCFGLSEIWLDSNRIEDVLEVSGLAGLPELQFLALQDNPFSTKPGNGTKPKPKPKTLSGFGSVSLPSLSGGSSSNRGTDNPHYDRDWKIRLWTWFHQERRARTPLELPLLKRSKHKTFKNAADGGATVSIGRMTREQWDKVRERSFSSVATTSGPPCVASSAISEATGTRDRAAEESQGLRGTQSNGANETNGLAASDSGPTERPPATTIPGVRLMAPMSNPRVTRKSKTRKVKIDTAEGECSKKSKNHVHGSAEKPKRRQGPRKSKKVNGRGSNVDKAKPLATADQKVSESVSKAIGRALGSTRFGTSSPEQTGLQSNIRFDIPPDKSVPLHSDRTKHQLSFSLEDVLISLRQQNQKSVSNLEESSVDASVETKGNDKNTLLGVEESAVHPLFPIVSDLDGEEDNNEAKAASNDDTPNNPFAHDSDRADIEEDTSQNNKTSTNVDEEGKDELVVNDHREDKKEIEIEANQQPEESVRHNSAEEESTNGVDALNTPEQNVSECNDDCKSSSTDEASNTRSAISSKHSSPRRSPQRVTRRKEDTTNEERIFVKPKVATIQLNRMSKYRPFDALTSDWDELVKKASEGRIPDGLVKSPVATTIESSEVHTGHSNKEIFSENQADLLASKSAESTSNAENTAINPAAPSRSASEPAVEPSLSSNNGTPNTLPEHIWQDDNSVLSSLGASRDYIVPRDRVNKFQLAEENSSYDGPDASRGLKVFENLDLYFETFVFPILMPDIPMDVLGEMEEDEDDWQLITMYHPRIQLWPDDRRALEKMRITSLIDSTRWTANRERFCRVWAEDLIPCGKPALRRLPPNRRIRLGFHGDKLFEEGNVDAYSECRKVLLCLSTKALYVIPEKDDVTLSHQQQANKRRFPLPLDRGDRFRDAPWPHAVARHPFGDLEAICIGFEFQRLTLRFRNPTLPGSDPFVYILLTGDKRTTVRILQEIQKLAKDLKDNDAIGQSSSTNGKKSADLPIENDAHIVLDSLNSVVENSGREESIGTIMHFQIVQQQWKRGDRGTVRRVVVITDTMLLLLDEDYAADGHDLSSITVAGHNMADARYRLVDCANISLVSEVQAAGSDPRAITILIKPSTLSRTHRWRLICRDREGAERLVEDARKALETL